jgi:hypothetical protein
LNDLIVRVYLEGSRIENSRPFEILFIDFLSKYHLNRRPYGDKAEKHNEEGLDLDSLEHILSHLIPIAKDGRIGRQQNVKLFKVLSRQMMINVEQIHVGLKGSHVGNDLNSIKINIVQGGDESRLMRIRDEHF